MSIVRFALVSLFLFFLLYLINYSTFVFLSREPEYQTQNSFPSTLVRKMHLNMLDATLSSFDQVFERFKSDAPKHQVNLILFLADKDPSTSLSWCPGTFFLLLLLFDNP
uniref:Uncharacterized protein n=1 Tax=Nelumbo nucifera TaxID=4432 RepID=A0A822ZCJ3_NELNU|nr:TPA_asm: hypothetical protein HUJ06_000470 [Nelumbo nucifera]